MFDSKSRTGTKQLREQLHQGWPVSNSSVALEQLGKDLREEMKQSLEMVRLEVEFESAMTDFLSLSLPVSPGEGVGSTGAGSGGERGETTRGEGERDCHH